MKTGASNIQVRYTAAVAHGSMRAVHGGSAGGGDYGMNQIQVTPDLDYFAGHEAYDKRFNENYVLSYPIQPHYETNFDELEQFLVQLFYRKLHINSEDHFFCMSEAPSGPPENRREYVELMFESFNARGLHLESAVNLAMYSHWIEDFERDKKKKEA